MEPEDPEFELPEFAGAVELGALLVRSAADIQPVAPLTLTSCQPFFVFASSSTFVPARTENIALFSVLGPMRTFTAVVL